MLVPNEYELQVEKLFRVPRQRVFEIWTRPEHIQKWFRAEPGLRVSTVEVDLRVGGQYRIGVRPDDDSLPEGFVTGVYREIDLPNRLVYTFVSDCSEGRETLVSVVFEDHVEGTILKLRHTGFRSIEERKAHEAGWSGCLGQLDRTLPLLASR
jgi:uncharacterized protein YndB with AHSA1/START domain